MKQLPTLFLTVLIIWSCAEGPSRETGGMITGAGSSFPYPVVAQWAYKYSSITKTRVNYQSIGSAGGIAQVKAGTVDFGITGAPLDAEKLEELNLLQVPVVIGGVVPVVNLPGIQPGGLKLTGALLADIYLGKVRNWNDPEIREINPELRIPDRQIYVVRRADGSGTTWIYTRYLSLVSTEFAAKIGFSKLPLWTLENSIAGKGNEGVASYVQRIEGAVGYVEFSYAMANNLTHVKMQNREGRFVDPGFESFRLAAEHADWDTLHSYPQLVNAKGFASWPITGMSFYLLSLKKESDFNAAVNFYNWCIEFGAGDALALDYVPLTRNMAERAKQVLNSYL